jgi:1,2-diacylglycerol 3-alpha-glucosyltransferase
MKIAIFTDFFLPHVDGITNSLAHLISQYKKTGHEVLVITPKTKGSENVNIAGVDILFLPSVPAVVYPELMLGFLSSKLLFKLRSFSPEIVHVIAPGPVGNIGLYYAKLINIKSVATFHGYFMEPEYLKIIGIKNRGVKLAKKILWRYTKSFYDRADRVITSSSFVKKDLENHNFSRQITVINNAINFNSIKKNQKLHQKFIEKFNLKNKKIVGYIGRVSIEKNISFLIKSFVEVQNNVKNSHLLIVGDGPDKERLENLVSELNFNDHVTFTGEIKNTNLIRFDVFSLIDVFATGSHSEVQPISILEAMYFGLPIVAVKSRGLTEMIKNNGFLITGENKSKFAEAIALILEDRKLQNKFSKQSYNLAESYSLENSAQKHIDLYTELITDIKGLSFSKRLLKSKVFKYFSDLFSS